MSALRLICLTALVFQAASSYVLLTANLDDLGVLMKQVAQSPVVDQLKKVINRATEQFERVARATDSGDPINVMVLAPGLQGERENDDVLERLGQRASDYLKAFQRFVETSNRRAFSGH